MKPSPILRAASAALLLAVAPAFAADLVVQIPGPLEARGSIGCGLFPGEAGFPMDNSGARMQWVQPGADGARCVFKDVGEGTYAVSVMHDLNGNRKVDTNFLGIPQEAWGVSNNVRPSLRAPRFAEAAFRFPGGPTVTLEIRVAQ